jgi:hypothetical protein
VQHDAVHCRCPGGLWSLWLSCPIPAPVPPACLPCREGSAKLFMMPLSAKRRAQNQVQSTPILSVLARLAAEAQVGLLPACRCCSCCCRCGRYSCSAL